jgi:hypothetical protein
MDRRFSPFVRADAHRKALTLDRVD